MNVALKQDNLRARQNYCHTQHGTFKFEFKKDMRKSGSDLRPEPDGPREIGILKHANF